MKRNYLFVVVMLCALSVQAQEKRTLTLPEAISLSVSNSKQLKSKQLNLVAAQAATEEAKDRQLPSASVSGSYLQLNKPNIEMKSSGSSGGSGGGISAPSNVIYGMVNLSVPIYSGGTIKYGIQSAKFLEAATALDTVSTKEELYQNTIEAFANLFKARTALVLLKENLATAKQRVVDFTNLEQNGVLPHNDLLKASLQASNIELALLDAENNWKVANLNMDLLLGLPTNTELMLDTTGLAKKDDARTLEDYLSLAQKGRSEKEQIALRKKAAELGIASIKGSMLPSLSFTGGYIAADIPGVLKVTNALNAGIGVRYSISSLWQSKAKLKSAKAQVDQLDLANSQFDDQIQLQVNKSYLNLISNRKKIEVNAQALDQAKENYRIVKNKFDNSLATATELLDADLAQLQTKLNFTLSRADAFVAYHKLLQSAGVLSTEFNK